MGCCNLTTPLSWCVLNFGPSNCLVAENWQPNESPSQCILPVVTVTGGFGELFRRPRRRAVVFEVPMPWLPFFSNCVGFRGRFLVVGDAGTVG